MKKKEKEKNINVLVLKITNLELIHKQSHTQMKDQELTHTRKTLQKPYKIYLTTKQRDHYSSGSRFITNTGIKRIKMALWSTTQIAELFHNFYTSLYNTSLYNIPPQNEPAHFSGDRKQTITEYLINCDMPTLPQIDTTTLEDPITLAEVLNAMKELKTGKSPALTALPCNILKCLKPL